MGLKVAVLGLGKIAKKHIVNLGDRAEIILVGRNLERAETFKNEQNLDSATVISYEKLKERKDIDGVIICTPPELHLQNIKDLWSTGSSLLVEKPLCISPEELAEIKKIQAEPRRGTQFLMVGENYYYKPSTIFLREKVASGALGQIKRIRIAKGTQHFEADWRKNYGALLEGGVHYLALLHDLMEAAGVTKNPQISSQIYLPEGMNVERKSKLKLEADAVIGELDYSWCSPALLKGLFQWSSVEGSKARVVFETNGILEASCSLRAGIPLHFNFSDIAGFRGLMDDFVQCLSKKLQPYSNFSRAERDLSVPFAVYRQHSLASTGVAV